MVPPPQTEPPSAPVPEKSTLGTSVFQATQPPSNSGAVTVFSLKSFVCCRNQPPASVVIPASALTLVRSISVSVCWLYVVCVAPSTMRGRLTYPGGSNNFTE